MNDSGAELAAGDWAAVGMELLKNIPKQGPFASETAFNSDLAFQGEYAYAGNYEGFMIYDLSNPRSPEPVSQVLCPGSQNDVSVYRTCSCSPPTRAARTTVAPAGPSRRRWRARGRA